MEVFKGLLSLQVLLAARIRSIFYVELRRYYLSGVDRKSSSDSE